MLVVGVLGLLDRLMVDCIVALAEMPSYRTGMVLLHTNRAAWVRVVKLLKVGLLLVSVDLQPTDGTVNLVLSPVSLIDVLAD